MNAAIKRYSVLTWILHVTPYAAFTALGLWGIVAWFKFLFTEGWSPVVATSFWWGLGLYVTRMFVITGYAHRGISHESIKMKPWVIFLGAILFCFCVMKSILWWAGHHRAHHDHPDEESDVHSPHSHSFIWSHFLWICFPGNAPTDMKRVESLVKQCPQLAWFEYRPVLYALPLLFVAFLLWHYGGWVTLIVAFGSTVVFHHAVYTINSLAHLFGKQRYKTGEQSRNNVWLAFLTLGEGWHNNHHKLKKPSFSGHTWLEMLVDFTYWLIRLLHTVRLVSVSKDDRKTVRGIFRFGSLKAYQEKQLALAKEKAGVL